MSTTTVSFKSTTRDAEIEELRRREAEAREAARRRIGVANATIAGQDERFQREVARLDEAAGRLPDLTLVAPQLPVMSSDVAQDPAKLESYAVQLTAEVDRFSRRLDAALAEAERLLERRIKKAAAWRSAADLEQQLGVLVLRCREDAVRIQEDVPTAVVPARPHPDAELEAVEAYVARLRQGYGEMQRHHAGLRARIASRESAMTLAGRSVEMRRADDTLSQYEAEQKARMLAALRPHLDDSLSKNGLCLDDLSGALRAQIDFIMDEAHCHDYRGSITRWIAREKQQRDGVARALMLLQCPPDLIHGDTRLSERWTSLAAQLQRIAGGLEDLTPSVDREYEQLRIDARRLVNTAFTKADWVRALNAEGLEVFEREDGQGLIVIDVDHPETWLEATPLEARHGGFGATLELKTDATVLADEAGVTDAICAKLTRAAGSATPEVATQAEVIEHERRITRARRPKAFAQRL